MLDIAVARPSFFKILLRIFIKRDSYFIISRYSIDKSAFQKCFTCRYSVLYLCTHLSIMYSKDNV